MERGSSNTLNANSVKDKGKSKDLKGGASCSAEVIVDQCIDVMLSVASGAPRKVDYQRLTGNLL